MRRYILSSIQADPSQYSLGFDASTAARFSQLLLFIQPISFGGSLAALNLHFYSTNFIRWKSCFSAVQLTLFIRLISFGGSLTSLNLHFLFDLFGGSLASLQFNSHFLLDFYFIRWNSRLSAAQLTLFIQLIG